MAASTKTDRDTESWWTRFKSVALLLFGLLALMWGIELIDTLVGGRLDQFGIRPRRIDGLWGILFAPFLHGGFAHLGANTISLGLFGGMLMIRSRMEFLIVFVVTTIVGGLGVWLFGSLFTIGNAVHIGASGVIFGIFGYILSMGLFERKLGSILLSVFVGVAYGGTVMGVLPGQEGISWESHLFGFLAGVGTAAVLGRRSRKKAALQAELSA